jgi:putative endonuclease
LRAWLRRRFPPKPLGRRGEDAAARFLKRKRYKIVGRGARDKLGELDLVAVDKKTVVFVEVKTRAHADGSPEEAVDLDKQRRLTRLALGFLRRHALMECASRFDVVAVTWPAGAKRPRIEHFENAFEAVGKGQMFR